MQIKDTPIRFKNFIASQYAPSILGLKICPRCNKMRGLIQFWKEKKWCKHCNLCRERNFSPTIQASRKKWLATPEGGNKQRAWVAKYQRGQRETPEGKEKHRLEVQAERKRHPDRISARAAVRHAIKSSRLVRQPCQECGAMEAEAHHPDYSKPLEVKWLCGEHHRAISREKLLREEHLTGQAPSSS